MYLEPWVTSFNSPCAFSHAYAFSRLSLSGLLFICPSDALHCLHAGCMPLYIIHLCFHRVLVIQAPHFFSILQTSPQLMKKSLKLKVTHWDCPSLESCHKLSKFLLPWNTYCPIFPHPQFLSDPSLLQFFV